MPADPPVTILVVDDSDQVRAVVAELLRTAGYAVVEATSGAEALRRAADGPDLIVLDVSLPDLDGFEVCRRIKRDPVTASIPVLHLSGTYRDVSARVDALENGADAYLTQPVEAQELLATVKALLRVRWVEVELQRREALFQMAETRGRRLATLVHVAQRLTRGLDLPTTLGAIADAAAAVFEGEAGFRLVDGEALVRVGATPAAERAMARERLRVGESLSGQVAATGEPVVIADTVADARVIPEHRLTIDPERTGALMCVPVRLGSRVLGTLHIYRERGYKFDEDALELATSLADQAAIAIENARLYGEAARRRQEAEELARLAGVLTEHLDLATLGERIAQSVLGLFGAYSASIRVLQSDGSLVALAWAGASREHFPPGHVLPPGMGIVGRALARQQPAWTPDILSEPDLLLTDDVRRRIAAAGNRAILAVPLRARGEIVGAVTVSGRLGRTFDDSEIRLAQAFADHAALALENARLYSETRERLTEAATLLAVGQVLAMDLPTQESVRRVAREVGRAVHADMVGAYFLDASKEALVPLAGYHVPPDLLHAFRQTPFPVSCFSSLHEEAWRTHKPVWTSDAMNDPRVDPNLLAPFRPRAVLFAPTPVRGEVVGGLFLVWWTPGRTFMPAELRLVEGVATQVGLALERAELTRLTQTRQAMQFAVTRVFAESPTLAEATHSILQAICDGAGWDLGEMWREDRDANRLSWAGLWHVSGLDAAEFESSSRDTTYAPGQGLPGRVWATAQAVWMPNAIAEDPGCLRRAHAARAGLRSAVAVPIRNRSDVTGVMVFFSRTQRHPDAALLRIVADLGAQIGQFIEPKQAEDALQESEARFRTLAESAFEGIALSDQGRIIDVNTQLAEILGYAREELLGREVEDLVAPEHRELVAMKIRSGYDQPYEHRIVRRDGSTRDVEVWSRAASYRGRTVRVMAIHDVTDRKRAEAALRDSEEQLRQAQKIEAVGRLAGGIAHDFNNLLAVISGRSHILQHRLAADDPLRRQVKLIQKTAERAAALTQQLLAFSRKQLLQSEVVDLSVVVAGLEPTLRPLIGQDVELVTVPDPTLGRVNADPSRLEQVVMNLAVNARDAMPQGGRLTIETANVELDSTFVRGNPGATLGPYVMLAVSDTGVGMSAEVQAHLFEPFFTTKPVGQGAGLGLATTYGIVKQHHGYIRVQSQEGRGTRVEIYLPRVDEPFQVRGAAPAVPEGAHGSETILLVEDEEGVRDLTREILRALGYAVLEARHPGEALLIAERHRGPIHLVLTDVVMPHLNGRELVERLQAVRSGLAVLYMSGYAADAIGRDGVLEVGTAFLQKPFSPEALVRKVRETLDAPRGD